MVINYCGVIPVGGFIMNCLHCLPICRIGLMRASN